MAQQVIHDVTERKNPGFDAAKQVMGGIMNGEVIQAQMASFLTGLRMGGESIEEITTCTMVMWGKVLGLTPSFDVIDIVGTGGDEADTFNISTTSASVIVTGGVPVARHGNHDVSSRNRATGMLERPDVSLASTAGQSGELLEETGTCFTFAQAYHSSVKYAAPVREGLVIRAIFDTLEPLSNPAGTTVQLLGVYDKSLVEPLAKVLSSLDVTHGLMIYDADGLDEAAVVELIHACEIQSGKLKAYGTIPEEVRLSRYELSSIIRGASEKNARVTRDILPGKPKRTKRGAVILNFAISLYLGTDDCTIEGCVRRAAELVDSSMTYTKLNEFVDATKIC